MVQTERRRSQVVTFGCNQQPLAGRKSASVVYKVPIQLEWEKVKLFFPCIILPNAQLQFSGSRRNFASKMHRRQPTARKVSLSSLFHVAAYIISAEPLKTFGRRTFFTFQKRFQMLQIGVSN